MALYRLSNLTLALVALALPAITCTLATCPDLSRPTPAEGSVTNEAASAWVFENGMYVEDIADAVLRASDWCSWRGGL